MQYRILAILNKDLTNKTYPFVKAGQTITVDRLIPKYSAFFQVNETGGYVQTSTVQKISHTGGVVLVVETLNTYYILLPLAGTGTIPVKGTGGNNDDTKKLAWLEDDEDEDEGDQDPPAHVMQFMMKAPMEGMVCL